MDARGDKGLCAEDINIAQKLIDERRRRPIVDLLRCAHLLDLRLIHNDDFVRDLERLLLVVGHKEGREVNFLVEFAQPAAQFLPHLRIKRAEGFVEQQHLGLHRQRPRQRDALPLAAGKLARVAIVEAFQLHQLEETVNPFGNLQFGRTLPLPAHV